MRGAISQLVAMGFAQEQAEGAARATDGEFERALQLLLDGASTHIYQDARVAL